MLHILDTPKGFEAAARDLEATVKRNPYGVLHVRDNQKTLQESVFEQEGKVRIGMITPEAILSVFPRNTDLRKEAEEVDTRRTIAGAR
ncbi:MAG: hypothetical protein A2Z31_04795 [candidate division NC10 bacterium RBG_16_65_8]|nr:MAG: hypothetical protein A2Z31_04795 [candidate division NC10 bacterium RBG_16_65_8]